MALEVALLVGADALLAELVGVGRHLSLGDANLFGDLADGINETLARLFGEVEELNLLRDFEAHPRDLALEAQKLLRLLAAQKLLLGPELLPLLEAAPETLADVLDAFDRPAQILVGLVLLPRQLGLLGEGHDVADVESSGFQFFADFKEFFDGDGRARDGLLRLNLAALDTLGDGDFALARQQRDDAHLAEVETDGVVRLLQRARREVELDVFVEALFKLVGGHDRRGLFDEPLVGVGDGDVRAFELLQHVLDVVGRDDVVGQLSIEVVESQVLLVAAQLQQALHHVVLVFLFHAQLQSPQTRRR